jgi:hypothetical protein
MLNVCAIMDTYYLYATFFFLEGCRAMYFNIIFPVSGRSVMGHVVWNASEKMLVPSFF